MFYNNKIRLTAALLIFLGSFNICFAQNEVFDQEVTIVFEDLSLKESLEKLEEKTGITTAYNENELESEKITITFEKELLNDVLDALLAKDNLSYKLIGNTVTIYRAETPKEEKLPEPTPSEDKVITQTPEPVKKQSQKYTLSGYITDEESAETLIGATLYCKELEIGTSSNEYGFYSITMPEGSYELTFSYVGYSSKVERIELNQTMEYSVALSIGNTLGEVVVTDDKMAQRHSETQMSTNNISLEKVKSLPALMGERDVLKIIQLMPGVQSGSEGTTGLYVRGGGPDQNLMLLDGVPVYNASHLFGFLSTFNGDAIKNVELIKGGFPARHGGRLSSIIDVRMKEGNMKKIQGDLTVGLISGRFNLEGPIVKDKTSFSFSGRRTWLDLLATPIQKSINKGAGANEEKNQTAYHLYDLNAKINHRFSSKSRLYLSSYVGNDNLTIKFNDSNTDDEGSIKWGNKLVTGRWNYQISPKLFTNTTVYLSTYDFSFGYESLFKVDTTKVSTELYTSDSNIRDYGVKLDFSYIPHPKHYIRTGVKAGLYNFTPTTTYQEYKEGNSPPSTTTNKSPEIECVEINGYVEDEMAIGNRIKLNAGVHLANFTVDKTNYFSAQPRVALSVLLTDKSSLKFSATKMTQFVHLLASPGLGLPTDLWVPSTAKIKPENSWQYGIGYTQTVAKGYELTVEGFYKDMDNLVSYRSGFNFFSSSKNWENIVDVGDGVSYGGEILFEKTEGKLTGWIGYTLSKSDRTFPNINQGETFPYKYDRRHDVGLAVLYKKGDRFDCGAVWVYGTGNTYTLGTTNYNAIGINDQESSYGSIFHSLGTASHIESRNNQRMPAYHRLDVSANFHKVKKRGNRTWSIGVYNAYARANPFVVYSSVKDNVPVLKQQSLIPILPYFSYSFKF